MRKCGEWGVESGVGGFGVAPVLYLLALIGIASSVLYSNYMQSMRAAIELNQSMAVARDLEAADKTMAALSVMSDNSANICPPNIEKDTNCSNAAVGLREIEDSARNPRTPENEELKEFLWGDDDHVIAAVFNEELGVKQIDPWGRYYIVCRWKGLLSGDDKQRQAFQIISAGADGILETKCGESASGDDYTIRRDATSALQRSSVWQVREGGIESFETEDKEHISIEGLTGQVLQFGAAGIKTDTGGNLWVPGNLFVQGEKAMFQEVASVRADKILARDVYAETVTATTRLSGASANIVGKLEAGSIVAQTGLFEGDVLIEGNLEVKKTINANDGYIKDLTVDTITLSGAMPSNPKLGMMRFNPDSNMFEGFYGEPPEWRELGGSGTITGECGAANGRPSETQPTVSHGACRFGTVSGVINDNNIWRWICEGANGGGSDSCEAPKIANAVCGNAHGVPIASAPASNLCADGADSAVSVSGDQYVWVCPGINGGSIANCSAYIMVHGLCGSSNGTSYLNPPSTNLCNAGNASTVTTNADTFTWTCVGIHDGSSANCSSPRSFAVDGQCGTAHGGSTGLTTAPISGLCISGSATSAEASGGNTTTSTANPNTAIVYSWKCLGISGGLDNNCYAPRTVNASCGTATSGGSTSAPTTNLCGNGRASGVTTGTSTFTWTCYGINDGGNVNCSKPRAINGVCRNSPQGCSAGTKANQSYGGATHCGGRTTSWQCVGTNGGATANCSCACYVIPLGAQIGCAGHDCGVCR